ncbi:MAG TPA: PLP-dependent aspartate aminotransferase family protein [Thermoanaerobaculaceae bacterium]|nr:PLP-dependent aspartate aminotransferase family protein [Thermoanaerobaculaceae bacterium]
MKPSTTCVHAGGEPDAATGAVTVPIYATSTYAYAGFGEHRGWEYSRTGNPTRAALERAVAELEGGVDACAFASGMAAIDAVTDLLSAGDHVVAADNLYGGSYRLFTTITASHGIEVTFVDASDAAAIAAACRPRTRLVFVETPTNPLMRLVDLPAAARVARDRGASLAVDNTFLSPVLQRPFEYGADLVVHSTTKYLNGHSDAVGGVAVARDADLARRLRTVQNSAGAIMGPFDAYLVLRGIRTLAVRMAAHEANGRRLAAFLAKQKTVERVHYPGLEDHPQHALARHQQAGFGGMISLDLGSLDRARGFCAGLKLFTLAESLGGVESLVCHPATMTHASIPAEERRRLGIGDGMVRLSVGIEDGADLEHDLAQALAAL